MTTEARIALLEAKDEIRELTARYCHGVVDGDADAITDLFCRDGSFRMGKTTTSGREALRAFYVDGVGRKTHKPFIQNHVIEIHDAEHASGRCSVEIRIFQEGKAVTAAGHYFDTYRKEDGRWRFSDRHFHPYHFAPWKEGWSS
ncbi:MAG: nuclear transport factor 2 family protein [Proteobacteria bacterium]|nr:nuclear transport factor 2 family protein [Pseudomonadota bacterium]